MALPGCRRRRTQSAQALAEVRPLRQARVSPELGAPSSHSRIVTWWRRGSPLASSRVELADQAVALGHDVVLVDRLEVLLARQHEGVARRGRELARRPCGSSRARSPRRSAGAGAPSRRPRPRRGASSARRSPSSSSPRRFASRVARLDRVRRSPRGSRRSSVPMPRWLWVATGTSAKTRSISSSVKPSSRRRSRERSATSSCAHGHAVMPCACTPTSRRVPRCGRHRRAEQRVDLLRRRAATRAPSLCSG